MKEICTEGELWKEALEYFGSEEKALSWFRTPVLALGGGSPEEYCTNHYSGDQTVRNLLNKLKHGLTA